LDRSAALPRALDPIHPTSPPSALAQAPAFFPPSFLYTQSWEDPVADEPHLQVRRTAGDLNVTPVAVEPMHAIHGGQRIPAVTLLWLLSLCMR